MVHRLLILFVALIIAASCAVAVPDMATPTPGVDEQTPVAEPTPDDSALIMSSPPVETPLPPTAICGWRVAT